MIQLSLPFLAYIAALTVAHWLVPRRGRPALLGLGWYLVLLFPVLGFFDIYYHRFSLLADHFQYLPIIGLVGWTVHVGSKALARLAGTWLGLAGKRHRYASVLIGIAVIGSCLSLTWQRSHVFANDGALARDAADKYPTSWLAFQKSGEFLLGQVKSGHAERARLLMRARCKSAA